MSLHEKTATELKSMLEAKQVSSHEIVTALIARRAEVDGDINAFCQRYDDQALREAKAADNARSQGNDLGLLHGLPMTVKENIEITGTDSTMGLRALVGKFATEDAVTVRVLKSQGAIVLGKTNVPQLLLAAETENSIHGITRNPWNTERSPGGSSGGEAAAICSGQSPFGIGTDIGGSIRIPAHFCGIFGLKPTVDRWSNRGSRGGIVGQEMVRAQMGPMARSAADLQLLMRAVDPLLSCRLDPAVPPLPMGDPAAVSLKGLRVGLFTDDGFLPAAASIQRAVKEAAQALRDAGATVVDYTPPNTDLLYTWLAGISSDGGETMRKLLDGEEVARQIQPSMKAARMPSLLRSIAAKVFEMKGDNRMASLVRSLGAKPVEKLWALTADRTAMRRAEFDAWNAQQLDAVLCPPHALPAMEIGTSGDLTLTLSYSFRYVMLNFPAGVAPVTRVMEEESVRANPKDTVEKRCAEVEAMSVGLPVGVQVVARPYREDVILGVLAELGARLTGSVLYPHGPIEAISGVRRKVAVL